MTLNKTSYTKHFILLFALLVFCLFINISLGSVTIPFKDIFTILLGEESITSWKTIIINYRIPKALTAILVGSGLSVSGLLMQTLFRNPLAGPFVLGISSGASLGVALLILGTSFLSNLFISFTISNWSLAIASSLGAFLVLIAVLIASNKIKNTMSILIIGLMFGSLTSAVINILSYFSSSEQIQQYQFWGFGSLGNLSWQELTIFSLICFISFLSLLSIIKPLNSFLLGENYAKSLGINIQQSKNLILLITCLLTGSITAFVGPIAFVGLAIPHITKLFFNTSNHKNLLPATALLGAIFLLICDCISQIPNLSYSLPINAITSLFGAPVVIWLLIRKKKIYV